MYVAVRNAATTATSHSTVWPLENVFQRISSFEKNPASGGRPAIAIVPMRNVQIRDRQVLLQAAHVAQVLLAVQRVDDRARSEEQQRLEERVRVEVEDAAGERADAHRQEHVAELRDGRVRQHALDVVLDQADRAGHQRRHARRRPR